MPDVDVVLGQTNTYMCAFLDVEQLLPANRNSSEKHHIVQIAPKLTEGNAEYIHHVTLIACDSSNSSYSHNHVINGCLRLPPSCLEYHFAWANGSSGLVLPADVGMPLGVNQYVLNVHYYNPSEDVISFKDSSGLRITLSHSPRIHDAGIFTFSGGMIHDRDPLPAGQADVTVTAVTPKECTNHWNVPSINVLGVLHHAHHLGVKNSVDVTSSVDDSYRGTLRREKRYDFNHQSFAPSSLSAIFRGDELTLTCSSDTSTQTEPTPFAENSEDEMCVTWFLYYPAQEMHSAYYVHGAMYCSGMSDWLVVNYSAPVVDPPACTSLGDLNSTEASNILNSLRADLSQTATPTTPSVPVSVSSANPTYLFSVSSAFVLLCV